MDNDFLLNSAAPTHFESTSSSPVPSAWHSLSAADHSPDSLLRSSAWERSAMDQSHQTHFDFSSALSSIVSSPAASNSNVSNDGFAIRELIGKLGSIGNSGEISPHSRRLFSYGNGSSPPKSTLPDLGKSGPLDSTVEEFSADPGFAERAARFSCFGSRSFNGRTNTTQSNLGQFRSNPLLGNGKLSRVCSSPSLKALANPQLGGHHQNSADQLGNSQEESTVSEQNPIGENENGLRPPNVPNSRKRKAVSVSKAKGKESSPTQQPKGTEADAKRCKLAEENGSAKAEEDEKKQSNQKPPEAPKDYIHVRARRGQATDSHSLAERVRREKISERMKLLQDLVPGCNKVTGKALMLDEIINYVQSLQRQVEFLSMKLASVNTNMDSLVSKDIFQSNNTSMPHPIFPLDSSALFGQQNEAINGTPNQSSVDPLDSALCRNLGLQLPQLDGFGDGAPQYQTFCEDDLQSIVQMGFAQNVHGSTQEPSSTKMEL